MTRRTPVVRLITAFGIGAALVATMLLSATAVGATGADHGSKTDRAAETERTAEEVEEAGESQESDDLAEGTAAVINDEPVNLRAEATIGADILSELMTGSEVTILDGPTSADGYDWYQVETDDGTGWVAGLYLTAA